MIIAGYDNAWARECIRMAAGVQMAGYDKDVAKFNKRLLSRRDYGRL